MKFLAFSALLLLSCSRCGAYRAPRTQRSVSRRDFGLIFASGAAFLAVGAPPQRTHAFEGSGSSAFAGKTTTSKAELQKSYRARIAADVRDFNSLGAAIRNGDTEGDAWVNFFIPYARREADGVGRAYAAFADLVGAPDRSGCGYLLAASLVKPGKPPENAPGVKKYNALAKSLEAINEDGKKGDAAKAQKDWEKAGNAFSDYLAEVNMPASLSDGLYK